jgi:transposase
MHSVMELKRTFSNLDWAATPEPVKQYIIHLEQTIVTLVSSVHQLEKRIKQLEVRANKNSQNSSKPPSSDGPFKKPKKKIKKNKRKKGAQKGHKGHRQQLLEPTQQQEILPEKCECGCSVIIAGSLEPYYTQQVIDLPEIQMDILHLILNKGKCQNCGKIVKAKVPKEHQTGYGPRLSALIAEMSGIQGNSRDTVRTFCKSVLNFSISIGAIQSVVDRASAALKPIYDKIGELARENNINHVDETSWFQNGTLNWLWVMVNRSVAYFMIHKNRSKEAFLELIQDWRGILVSDNYGTYKKWANLRQTCLAHLIRKAKALSESKDKGSQHFGKKILKELQLLCHWAKAPPDVDQWYEFYQRFIDLLFDHNQQKDEAGALARSLIRQIDSLWVFLEVSGVEPTNNHAERTLRFGVLWRKRSKGTQSEKGNRWVERILSFKQTCQIRSMPSFPLLVDAIDSFFKEQKPNLDWL